MEMDRPPVCNSKKCPDEKLKSDLEWPLTEINDTHMQLE